MDVLSPREQKALDAAVDQALIYIARQQQSDGSIRTLDTGQPGVTALCLLAFMSRGHLPGEGVYGRQIDAGIDYILSCQRKDGMICRLPVPSRMALLNVAQTGLYNHAIGGILLCEVYGLTRGKQADRIRQAIEKGIAFSRAKQVVPKQYAVDHGGWRYLRPWQGCAADLSVTAWNLMFYRAAKNAGFEVPVQYVDDALAFVKRCFNEKDGTFYYGLVGPQERHLSRGMAGAGILSLSLAGLHETPMAQSAGHWILRHPFTRYGATVGHDDRFHYAAYYCSQGMFQLGGDYWRRFFPVLVRTLVNNQGANGSWQPDYCAVGDQKFGKAYSTALAVLALSPPYQLLSIFQR
jgi:hypothetical protein